MFRWALILPLFLRGLVVCAAVPTGYYDSAEGLLGAPLEQALHDIIDEHTVISYSRTDEVMRVVCEDPTNTANVELIYSSFSMPKEDLGSSGALVWNREHVWPRSYCIGNSGPDNSDLHNLFPCNAAVNSSRGNKFFDETMAPGTMNSVSPENTYDGDSWEPADEDKGRVARAVLYVALRYDGSDSGTGDMSLSDFPDSSLCRMGHLTTILDWNRRFPPTAAERARNDGIYEGVNTTAGFLRQGNRNPFVDYPQLADAIYLDNNSLTYGKWQIQSFTFTELEDEGVSAFGEDPDGDGKTNLVEFVGDSNPVSSQSVPFQSVELVGENAVIRYRRVKGLSLSGVSFEWQVAIDLATWSPALIAPVEEVDEGATVVESLSLPTTGERHFWRLALGINSF